MQKKVFLGSAVLAAVAAFVVGCDKVESTVAETSEKTTVEQPAASGVQSDVVALPPMPKDADVIASVGEAKMTWAELTAKVDETIQMYSQMYGQPIPSEELPKAKQSFRRIIVQQFIIENIIVQAAAANGVVVDDAYFAQEVAAIEKETGRTLDELLAARKGDAEKLKEDLRKGLLEKRLLDEKVFSKVQISAEEVQAALEKNLAEIALADEMMAGYAKQIAETPASFEDLVKANSVQKMPIERPEAAMTELFGEQLTKLKEGEISSVIDIPGAKAIVKVLSRTAAKTVDSSAAKAKIDSIRERLLKGEDFAALAKEFSDCPSGARDGGNLGTFGKGQMVPEFEQAVFSQPVGAIGEVVQTAFGYHVIKVTSRDEANGTASAAHILVKTDPGTPATISLLALITPVPQVMEAAEIRAEMENVRKQQAAIDFLAEQRKTLGVTCTLFPELAADPLK